MHLAKPTQKVALLSKGAGSVTRNVLERTGTPAVTGPQIMLSGVTVGAVGLLKVLFVWVGVVLGIRCAGLGLLGQGIVGVGWRRLIGVAGGNAALVEGPTWTSGFILPDRRRGEERRERVNMKEPNY